MDYEKEWEKLVKENDKLKKEYEDLIKEMKIVKNLNLNRLYGNGFRYKIVKWLIK